MLWTIKHIFRGTATPNSKLEVRNFIHLPKILQRIYLNKTAIVLKKRQWHI